MSSNVEINFSLGQEQTVLLLCGWRGQFKKLLSNTEFNQEFTLRIVPSTQAFKHSPVSTNRKITYNIQGGPVEDRN